MGIPKHAAKQDANQPGLVDLMRKMGAHVIILGDPCDLLVAHRGRLIPVEVKASEAKAKHDAKGENKTQRKQRALRNDLAAHGVKVWTIWKDEQVIALLGRSNAEAKADA